MSIVITLNKDSNKDVLF